MIARVDFLKSALLEKKLLRFTLSLSLALHVQIKETQWLDPTKSVLHEVRVCLGVR